MSKVVIVGGGAAGMFASIAAAECGHQVVVYEKNEKLGKKLYITGKGRCNITNACDVEGLFEAVRTNAKFLYSSFYGYTNQQVIDFFERINVPVKIERGDRVFRCRIVLRMSSVVWSGRWTVWAWKCIFARQ